jgi:tetratricopeptide (TPR) repeat protein
MGERSSRLALVALVLLCASGVARAEDINTTQAREHYNKGAKAFALGKFDDAIKEYEAAYELRDDPVFLYNIAQAHRLNRNPERALFFYRSYLSHAPRAENAADVRQKIADLQKLVDEQAHSQTAPPTVPITPERGGTPAEPPAPTPAPAAATSPPPPADSNAGRTKTIAGIALVAGGAAILVTGIVLSALVPGINSDLQRAANNGGTYDPSLQSRAKTYQIVGPVLDGVGGLAAVAGGVLMYLGHRDKASAHASVTPMVGPGLAGAAVQGSF